MASDLCFDRAAIFPQVHITTDKPTFYEQVTGVKVCSLLFPSWGFAFIVALGFVVLHRVSIRTLDELC
jgi:hypothetical protein